MAAGGARRGRRDNGLNAAEYAVVGDVDPRVGEHLLDVLAAGGIAAYLQPASDLNPVTRTTTVPARPTDRLYVDREHLATARDYVDRLAADEAAHPGPKPSGTATAATPTTPAMPDIEAEWARLVAGFHQEVDPATRPWPAAENVERNGVDRADATTDPPRPAWAPEHPAVPPRDPDPDEPSLIDGLDTFGARLPDSDDDEEEGYTPPPPPPLPRISKYAVTGVLGVIGGFVLFLFPELLPLGNGVSMLFGFVAILGGFMTLIWRLRPGDSDDDIDPDDGAVV